jgi:bacterioferritin-associated ferredoxin
MYVCNCNGLTVTDVVKACAGGIQKVDDVFVCYNVEKCCGKCVPEIEEYLQKSKK